MRYYALDMIFNIHSNVLYISDCNSKSIASGNFLLGGLPYNSKSIKLNVAVYTLCTIIKFMEYSAEEAELGELFLNLKGERIIRLNLDKLGHPHPPTPIYCDNSTAAGIVNGTVNKQR